MSYWKSKTVKKEISNITSEQWIGTKDVVTLTSSDYLKGNL